jgi:hypothetical protein
MQLTIESRNAQEHKLQDCNNQNTADRSADKNAAGYDAAETAKLRTVLTGAYFNFVPGEPPEVLALEFPSRLYAVLTMPK